LHKGPPKYATGVLPQDPGVSLATSSPPRTYLTSRRSSNSNLYMLVINFQNILSKKAELECSISATKPDIIIGSETWLRPSIGQGEFFPDSYRIYRKDRSDGYGGVLIAIHTSLSSHQVMVDSNTEFIAAKILSVNSPLLFYRPPNNSSDYMDTLNQAITDLCKHEPNSTMWLAGDMNLPDIDWTNEQVIHIQYNQQISDSFLQLLAKAGLEQVVDFPTRGNNILNILLTNRPSLENRCECAPGLSYHDSVPRH